MGNSNKDFVQNPKIRRCTQRHGHAKYWSVHHMGIDYCNFFRNRMGTKCQNCKTNFSNADLSAADFDWLYRWKKLLWRPRRCNRGSSYHGCYCWADIPMFMGAMIMGPVAALCMKQVDKLFEGRIKRDLK